MKPETPTQLQEHIQTQTDTLLWIIENLTYINEHTLAEQTHTTLESILAYTPENPTKTDLTNTLTNLQKLTKKPRTTLLTHVRETEELYRAAIEYCAHKYAATPQHLHQLQQIMDHDHKQFRARTINAASYRDRINTVEPTLRTLTT